MTKVKWFLKGLMKVEMIIGGLLVISIVLFMCTEIVMRYIFESPIIFIQEFVTFLFIVITALGASVGMKSFCHITIDTLVRLLSERMQIFFKVLASVLMCVCFIFLITKLPGIIRTQNMSKTSSLPINFPRGYYYSLPILYSVIVMLITNLYYLYYFILEMIGRSVTDEFWIDRHESKLAYCDEEEIHLFETNEKGGK